MQSAQTQIIFTAGPYPYIWKSPPGTSVLTGLWLLHGVPGIRWSLPHRTSVLQHSNQSIRQLEEDALLYADVLPELTYKISSIDAGIRLAEQGYGIAFTLNSYLSTMRLSPNSVVLQVGDPALRIPFSAAFRKGDEHRSELMEWIRLTKEVTHINI